MQPRRPDDLLAEQLREEQTLDDGAAAHGLQRPAAAELPARSELPSTARSCPHTCRTRSRSSNSAQRESPRRTPTREVRSTAKFSNAADRIELRASPDADSPIGSEQAANPGELRPNPCGKTAWSSSNSGQR